MESKRIAAMVFSVISGLVLCDSVSYAADGEIDFTGSVIDTACTMDIGANNKMSVILGNVAKTAFSGPDSVSSVTEFDIKLKSCPEVTTASVKFDGVTVPGNHEVLALTEETGAATGIGIQITDQANKVVAFETATDSYPLVAGDNTLPFYASFIQTDAAVVAGTANATAQFTINYN